MKAAPLYDNLDWANHLDWMEGLEPSIPQHGPRWPGVVVASMLTLVSLILSSACFWPFRLANGMHPLDAALLAMLLGMFIGNIGTSWKILQTGMRYSAKTLLPLGIVLLGARLDFAQMLQVGIMGLLLSVIVVVTVLLATCYLVAPLFGMESRFAFLLGAGTAICGGSAIVAVAPIVRAKEEEIVLGIASVTFVGLIAMLSMPLIAAAAHLNQMVYGVWVGLSIHQMPQVIAAGFAYGPTAGESATVIKLVRICLLAPVVVGASLWVARQEGRVTRFSFNMLLKSVPPFVIGFILVVGVCTLGLLPSVVFDWPMLPIFGTTHLHFLLRDVANYGANFFLALGMAGVGWETRVSSLLKAGLKPMAVTTLVSLFLALAALAASEFIFGSLTLHP